MKYFVISGGGTGIGQAIAERLSKDNKNHIAICGRSRKSLSETLARLDNSQNHCMMVTDVTSLKLLRSLAREFPFPKLDGLIANAGLGGANHFGPNDRWDEIISTNLSGTYNFVNTFLPFLKKNKQEYKHIVITSSVLARLGVPNYSAYCASKAGLLGLMRSWAAEFARDKILVNAICPGWVDTKMARDGIEEIARRSDSTYEESFKAAMQFVPLRKMSKPEEIGDLVYYLVNQISMTGQTLDINNGSVMNS
jgi:NAD(P)-dependent dehydrogenase (short-subunit alcohol dehydrogenase family)